MPRRPVPRRPPDPQPDPQPDPARGLVHVHDDGPHVASFLNVPVGEGWYASGDAAVVNAELAIVNLSVHPLSDPRGYPVQELQGGIDSDVLRSVRLSEIRALVWAALAAQPGSSAAWEAFLGEPVPEWRHQAEKRATTVMEQIPAGPPRPGGRRKYDDTHHRRIAEMYLRLQSEGIGRGILNRIARAEKIPRETARDWVSKATREGYLSPGSPGRAGRTAGPRLIAEREG